MLVSEDGHRGATCKAGASRQAGNKTMKRYVTTAGMFFTEWGEASTAEHVIEKEREVRKTGILDATGNDIYSIDEMMPIGFFDLRERK